MTGNDEMIDVKLREYLQIGALNLRNNVIESDEGNCGRRCVIKNR